MNYFIRLVFTLALLAVISVVFAQDSPGHVVYSHQDVFDCSVYHGANYAIAGAVYNKANGQIVSTWWIGTNLGSGKRAKKSHSGTTITVKIQSRTPYNTYVTVASNQCSSP